MFDSEGTPEANYWLARNRLRQKFGLSAKEADEEEASEVAIHMFIWEKLGKRREFESEKAERRSGRSNVG